MKMHIGEMRNSDQKTVVFLLFEMVSIASVHHAIALHFREPHDPKSPRLQRTSEPDRILAFNRQRKIGLRYCPRPYLVFVDGIKMVGRKIHPFLL
jgi:hypothetical protein